MIDGERTYLTGTWRPSEDGTPAERIAAAGIPDLLFERFAGRLEWHRPWHTGRELSHLFRGKVDVEEANELLRERGHDDLRFLDNGAIGRPMEGIDGPPTPTTWSPAGRARRRRSRFHMRARGYAPEECIAVGDSIEDLDSPTSSGASSSSPTARSATRRCARRSPARPNVTVTEGRMGDGVYEAVVSTLAERG